MTTTASDPDAVVVVLTTVDSGAAGAALARRFVAEGLVACVNLVPGLRSIYRWQGEIEDAAECLLVMKTAARQLSALQARLHECHGYETPEWLVIGTTEVSSAYRHWLLGQLADPPAGSTG